MNKPYLLFICLTLIKCNGPQAKQEKQCVENLKFPELGKFFSKKNCLFALNHKEKHSEEQKKADSMKLFRQEAIRKKASKQKSLQKESKFSKSLSNFEKESFPLV